jgi:hypothetical protein
MKRKNRDLDIFSLSFLDIISCGFGAVVLLVLISSNSESSIAEEEEKAIAFLQQVLKAEETVKSLQRDLAVESGDLASKELLLGNLQGMSDQTMQQQQSASEKSEKLQKTLSGLELVQTSLTRLKRSSISQGSTLKRDVEVGGIPVDSDYVIFIVDTSGSMKEIWNRVTSELENIIRIHPKIKGFQILNDNGTHILSGYEGRWIPDTPKRRESVISLFKTWNSASNSSPVEGLEVALRRYANPNTKLSIYIFGDEYSGASYDPVINALVNLNTNRVSGANLARIHAVGFISNYSTGRFATLMREVTRRNNGTFIALQK